SLVALRIDAALPEFGAHLRLHFLELSNMGVEIATLSFEILDVQPAAAQQLAQLLHAGAVDLVEIEQLADLGEREAQPLAAQDPAQPGAVAGAVQAGAPLAARPWSALTLLAAGRCGRGGDGHCGVVIVDFSVNVNTLYVNGSYGAGEWSNVSPSTACSIGERD